MNKRLEHLQQMCNGLALLDWLIEFSSYLSLTLAPGSHSFQGVLGSFCLLCSITLALTHAYTYTHTHTHTLLQAYTNIPTQARTHSFSKSCLTAYTNPSLFISFYTCTVSTCWSKFTPLLIHSYSFISVSIISLRLSQCLASLFSL